LLAHHPHRQIDGAADHRLAGAGDQPRKGGGKTAIVDAFEQLARHHQTPGRGMDEKRTVTAQMRGPVTVGDLIADQRVAGGGVGDAQQRLGQAHQRDALLAGEREFTHQPSTAPPLGLARSAVTSARGGGGLVLHVRRQRGLFQQRGEALGLAAAIGFGDRAAQRRGLADGRGEGGEGPKVGQRSGSWHQPYDKGLRQSDFNAGQIATKGLI
jgi:hypothetical protein